MNNLNKECPDCNQQESVEQEELIELLVEEQPKLTYEDKIAICRTCPNLQPVTEKCSLCGCYMQVKARFPFFSCPEEKW